MSDETDRITELVNSAPLPNPEQLQRLRDLLPPAETDGGAAA